MTELYICHRMYVYINYINMYISNVSDISGIYYHVHSRTIATEKEIAFAFKPLYSIMDILVYIVI